MQLQLISFVLILRCMEYTNCQQHTRHRQQKQSAGCQSGCLTCSEYNGCLSCKPRLFIFLERNGMKQTGVCLASCPSGYYGTRSPDRNDCTKCRPECDSCFTSNFCTRCRPGFYLHQGKCQQTCPEGRVPSLAQRECVPECPADCDICVNSDTCTRCAAGFFHLQGKCYHTCPEDYEPSELLLECIPQVHCEVDEWSEWSPCSRPGKACFKRGEETRTRKVLRTPSPHGNPCPITLEKRNCVVKKKKCQVKGKGTRNNRKNKENQDSRHERKREREKGERKAVPAVGVEREDSENRNKTERRRRRGHARSSTSTDGGTGQ